MARQMVGHGHVRVDGRTVTIPSYLVRSGEVITLGETAARMPTVQEELASQRVPPAWLGRQGATGQVLMLPRREDLDLPVREELIVAFYAR